MPDDQVKSPGRVIGRSRTHEGTHGKVLVLTQPVDRAYLCLKMCGCHGGAKIRNSLGHELKQRCTTARIWADEELNQLVWRYKAEVGFNMIVNPPAPLMSREQPNRPSRFPLGRAMGDGLLKRDLEGGPQKGALRIPDCIILSSTVAELAAMRASGHIDWDRLIPVKRNIETVLEIKFDGDRLNDFQKKDYAKIAGPDKFRLLSIGDCDCRPDRTAPVTAPIRVPVTTPMKREPYVARRWFQFRPPQPEPAPAPLPQLPQYGSVSASGEHRPLSQILKEHPVTAGGVMLVGTILLIIPITRVAIAAAGALLAVSGAASAAPKAHTRDNQ